MKPTMNLTTRTTYKTYLGSPQHTQTTLNRIKHTTQPTPKDARFLLALIEHKNITPKHPLTQHYAKILPHQNPTITTHALHTILQELN